MCWVRAVRGIIYISKSSHELGIDCWNSLCFTCLTLGLLLLLLLLLLSIAAMLGRVRDGKMPPMRTITASSYRFKSSREFQ